MTNENENFGAITTEEYRQNLDVFTMANVQNYILAQRAENTVKKLALFFSEKPCLTTRKG